MSKYNIWMPGDKTYAYNGGQSLSYEYVDAPSGKLLAEVFNLPTAQDGVGTTFDMVDPPFDITKPPKVCYSCTSAFVLTLKDADGWLWSAECPKQTTIKERGWDWSQFDLSPVQDAEKNGVTRPASPAAGKLLAFQFQGAEGVHGTANNVAQRINIAYIAGRSPEVAGSGTISKVSILDRNPNQHTWKIGDVRLDAGSRRAIAYYGTLPFGLMLGGPSRSRLSSIPYRGPYIAGYQSGTPWVDLDNTERLSSMLDFMLESQEQFRQRHPDGLLGPFMHCYLPATWDSEQTGKIDSWVFDAPDGNPAWTGWQYRAFDAMAQTWSMVSGDNARPGVTTKVQRISLRFLTWIYTWMTQNPDVDYIPAEWGPPGWSQGTPLPADSYLDPHGTKVEPHDLALVLKGAIYCAIAGADETVCRYVIARAVRALALAQVQTPTDPMRGAFTFNPGKFEVYSFHQGEILDALALASQYPELVPSNVVIPGAGDNPKLQLSADHVEFDDTPVGAFRTMLIDIANVGSSNLMILSTTVTGNGFSMQGGAPASLAAGETGNISLKFEPRNAGHVTGALTIYSNDPTGPHKVRFAATAEGLTPAVLTLSANLLEFDETASGSTSRKTLTITNSGASILQIASMTINGQFSLVGAAPNSVGAGDTVVISVDFAPTALGEIDGELIIVSNSDGSPHRVGLSGRGTPQAVNGITWLTAAGSDLIDGAGKKVILKAANWYGMEGILMPAILWARAYKSTGTYTGLLDQMAATGFNALRIPVCEDITWPNRTIVAGNSINAPMNRDFLLNPNSADGAAGAGDLIPSIEILDKILDHCETLGVRVVLDMHCLAPNTDNGEGTGGKWYTTATPGAAGGTTGASGEPRNEEQWIQAWEFLANRYKNRPVVCGFDLINEPHNCTWDRDALTGIVGAYERCAARIQAINPHALIICEGIAGNITLPAGDTWGALWGSNLSGVKTMPVSIPIKNKLVYSPHDYANYGAGAGPGWIFDARFPGLMSAVYDALWGFIAKDGIAPVFLGEFGGNFLPGETLNRAWMSALSDYCIGNGIHWAYWSIPGSSSTAGLQGLLAAGHQDINTVTISGIQGLIDYSGDGETQTNYLVDDDGTRLVDDDNTQLIDG